mmetsp:Transcript_36587/g.91618  ORF Transcript_36587/g.91618 Transcript_36587/m.91618 type:complete len:203 (-) Transcript_36587:802-1410(-)
MVTTVLKSTPIVDTWKSEYTSWTKRVRRQLFPTPESPTVTSLNLKSPSPAPSRIWSTLRKNSFLEIRCPGPPPSSPSASPFCFVASVFSLDPPKTMSLSCNTVLQWDFTLICPSYNGLLHLLFAESYMYKSETSAIVWPANMKTLSPIKSIEWKDLDKGAVFATSTRLQTYSPCVARSRENKAPSSSAPPNSRSLSWKQTVL